MKHGLYHDKKQLFNFLMIKIKIMVIKKYLNDYFLFPLPTRYLLYALL